MSRIRIATGLLAGVLGTALWAGELSALWNAVTSWTPFVLIALAVVGGFRAVAPRGVLAGPAMLLLAGGGWLLWRYGQVQRVDVSAVLAGVLVVGGFVVALGGEGRSSRPDTVRRCSALLLSPRPVELTGTAPAKVSARAVLASLVINLREVRPSGSFPVMELDITVLGGRVEVVVPAGRSVQVGRIHARRVRFAEAGGSQTRSLRIDDEVEMTIPLHDPARQRSDGEDEKVLLNVLGLAGEVVLRRV